MLDFAALPPEINSARMYSGPGSAPMMAAAAAWNTIAAEIRSAAASYSSVLSGLTSESWFGPSSTLMSAAIAPYLEWLNTTATQAEQTATQANAAAAAYQSAFAMTVPPPVIAANRTQLANLVATNIFGQNTAAIAATEAQYGQMWAQDTAAMTGYATGSSAATQLTPFTAPQSNTNAAGVAQQANAVAQATNSSANTQLPGLLGQIQRIFQPNSNLDTTGLAGLLNDISGSNGALLGAALDNNSEANLTNAFTTSGLINPTSFVDAVTAFNFLYAAPSAGSGAAAASGAAAGGEAAASGATAGLAGSASVPAVASAEMARANLVGALSVPPSWSGTGATISPVLSTTQLGAGAYHGVGAATPMVMEDVGPVGVPGAPLGAMADPGDSEFGAPIYGFRLRIMGRPPAAG